MLNVFLGYGCNLKCSYCLQAPMAQRSKKGKPDPKVFIDKVLPWVIEKDIRKIAYWGGEPLVYWDIITEIHEAFIAAGHSFDMIKIATNGTLFTDKHVKQCNDWGAYVILSQHPDFGTPVWDKVMDLNNCSLSYLYHKHELSPWKWLKQCEELEEKYNRPVFPFMHWVRSTDGASKDSDLTYMDLNKHVPELWKLAELAVQGHRHAEGMWTPYLLDWKEKLNSDSVVPMCYGDHQIDIDLEGNKYICHHTVEPSMQSGSIFNKQENIIVVQQARKFVDTKECKSCEINKWCRGNCHLSRTHSVDCRLSKEKHRILSWLDERMKVNGDGVYSHD